MYCDSWQLVVVPSLGGTVFCYYLLITASASSVCSFYTIAINLNLIDCQLPGLPAAGRTHYTLPLVCIVAFRKLHTRESGVRWKTVQRAQELEVRGRGTLLLLSHRKSSLAVREKEALRW